MKVGDARHIYGEQISTYNLQRSCLAQQKKALLEKAKNDTANKDTYEKELEAVNLQYDTITGQQEECQKYMNQVMQMWNAKLEEVLGQEQSDNIKEAMKEMAKIMEVARRIMRGDKVPPQDEKRLMEYDAKLYQMAKSAQITSSNHNKKKYDSLWEDEEGSAEQEEQTDPIAEADAQEITIEGPALES